MSFLGLVCQENKNKISGFVVINGRIRKRGLVFYHGRCSIHGQTSCYTSGVGFSGSQKKITV